MVVSIDIIFNPETSTGFGLPFPEPVPPRIPTVCPALTEEAVTSKIVPQSHLTFHRAFLCSFLPTNERKVRRWIFCPVRS